MIRLEKKAEILSGYLGEWLVALCTQSRYVTRLLQSDRIRNYPEAEGFYGRVRSQAVVRRMRPRVTRAISVELVDMRVNSCYWDRNGRSNATGFIAFTQVSFAKLRLIQFTKSGRAG